MTDPFLGIYWHQFDWPSFATLATGLAAVGAAIYVGRKQAAIAARQAEISKKQTDILERQTALAEITLRNELFDKRFAIFDHVRQYLGEIVAGANSPQASTRNNMVMAMQEAKFLFGSGVNSEIERLWNLANTLFSLQAEMRMFFNIEKDYRPGDTDKERDLLIEISDEFFKVEQMFVPEMNLSIYR